MEAKNLAMQSGQLIAARIVPFTETTDNLATQTFDNFVVLVDTSASQAPYLADNLKRLETLLSQLKVGTLRLYTFDQNLKEIGIADTFATQTALLKQLQQHQALGASRLDAAIATLKTLELKQARLLLISDTVITAGETNATVLATQLKAINWLKRIDILVPSYHSDKNMARRLTKAGQLPGIVAPLTLSDVDLIRKLKSHVYADIPIKISGSTWHWPEKVAALQTNEPLIVFGELTSEQAIHIQVGDKELSLATRAVEPILLKREWVRARVDKLLAMEETTSDKDMKNAFHNEIINLSVKERVLSPYTALLVLETENDYRRYNIERRGLADILTIDSDGITVLKRTQIEPQRVEVPMSKPAVRQQKHAHESSFELFDNSKMPSSSNSQAVKPVERPAPRRQDLNDNRVRPLSTRELLENLAENLKNIRQELKIERLLPTFKDSENLGGFLEELRHVDLELRDVQLACYNRRANIKALLKDVPQNWVEIRQALLKKIPQKLEEIRQKLKEARSRACHTELEENSERCRPFLKEKIRRVELQLYGEQTYLEYLAHRQAKEEARQQAIKEARHRAEIEARQPWTGHYAKFRALLDKADLKAAGKLAQQWRQDNLADVMALIALGIKKAVIPYKPPVLTVHSSTIFRPVPIFAVGPPNEY